MSENPRRHEERNDDALWLTFQMDQFIQACLVGKPYLYSDVEHSPVITISDIKPEDISSIDVSIMSEPDSDGLQLSYNLFYAQDPYGTESITLSMEKHGFAIRSQRVFSFSAEINDDPFATADCVNMGAELDRTAEKYTPVVDFFTNAMALNKNPNTSKAFTLTTHNGRRFFVDPVHESYLPRGTNHLQFFYIERTAPPPNYN